MTLGYPISQSRPPEKQLIVRATARTGQFIRLGMLFALAACSSTPVPELPKADEKVAGPPPCAPPPEVTDVALGASHTCALAKDGAVYCWGKAELGATGDPTRMDRSTPFLVMPPGSAVAISAGLNHTCALTEAGRVSCWGADSAGQLGDGPTTQSSPSFESTSVATGQGPECRDRTCKTRAVPGVVPGLDGVDAIFARGDRTCARRKGRFLCWGGIDEKASGGQAWPGSHAPEAEERIPADAMTVEIGGAHGCALTREGLVRCWGSNHRKQLGADGARGVQALAVADDNTCVIRDGSIQCWGSQWRGTPNGKDLETVSLPKIPMAAAKHVALAGGAWACAAPATGGPTCWGLTERLFGEDNYGPAPVPGHSEQVDKMRLGEYHGCLISKGRLRCFGRNDDGELGNGHARRHLLPHQVRGVSEATTVTTSAFACATVGAEQRLLCWGDVPGEPAANPGPRLVAGLERVHQVAVGSRFACAIAGKDRKVRCWGSNEDGELAQPDRDRRSGLVELPYSGVRKISADSSDACALLADGAVACWGYHRRYDKETVARAFTGARDISVANETLCHVDSAGRGHCADLRRLRQEGVSVPVEKPLESVHAFNNAVCARATDGTFSCFDMDRSSHAMTPIKDGDIPSVGGIASIQGACLVDKSGRLTCRRYFTWEPVVGLQKVLATGTACAVHTDGTVSCWGSNVGGEADGVGAGYHAALVDVEWPAVPAADGE